MNTQQTHARSALEALRSGVPSRHAVEQLGTTQDDIRDQFEAGLAAMANGDPVNPLVLSATFGGGKSHLLNYLKTLASNAGFVTSMVVVSPEMPLGNSHLVLKALAESAETPGRTGRAARELSSDLRVSSTEFAGLRLWTREAGLNERFPALLHLFEDNHDDELRQQIIGDFEGDSMLLSALRSHLKEMGQAAGYALKASKNALIAHERIRLLAQYYRACGCKGWVVFFDELERFPAFAAKQRQAAWVELGWWQSLAQAAGAAIYPVFAIASGHIDDAIKKDQLSFRSGLSDGDAQEREQFGRDGIAMMDSATRLIPPSREQDDLIMFKIKAIYEAAYGISLDASSMPSSDVRTTIRSDIRRWITHWDLKRYDPTYTPALTEEAVHFDDSEVDDGVMEDMYSELAA